MKLVFFFQERSPKKTYRASRENQERGKFSLRTKFFEANLSSSKDKRSLPIFVIVLWEEGKEDEPLILLTSLAVTEDNLQDIISIYNRRGKIDTLSEILKQSFGLERIMVRGWRGINIMIMRCLLSFVLSLCMFLTATKITFSAIKEFCQKKSVLKKKRLTIGKFHWATTEILRSPPYYCWSSSTFNQISVYEQGGVFLSSFQSLFPESSALKEPLFRRYLLIPGLSEVSFLRFKITWQ